MKLPVDITLTSEIEKVITFCRAIDFEETEGCERFCPLSTVCEKYWTEKE